MSTFKGLGRASTRGIPTTYAGVRFRSRAEARWAALFDLCALSWQYEPVDMYGYIPDFFVDTLEGKAIVEVKGGVTSLEGLREIEIEAVSKILNGRAPDSPSLFAIVGAHPIKTPGGYTYGLHGSVCDDETWTFLPVGWSQHWPAACNLTQWRPA